MTAPLNRARLSRVSLTTADKYRARLSRVSITTAANPAPVNRARISRISITTVAPVAGVTRARISKVSLRVAPDSPPIYFWDGATLVPVNQYLFTGSALIQL